MLVLVLGLEAKDPVLLLLTFLITSLTLVTGHTSVMLGAEHLITCAAFLSLALVP